jgi:hypothetical protein
MPFGVFVCLGFEKGSQSYLCPGWPQTHDLPASTSKLAGITGMHHHTQQKKLLEGYIRIIL